MHEYIYTININGMRCGMCESHINDAIRRNFKVKKVTSSHLKNKTVIISYEPIVQERIKEVIDATGYYFIDISVETREHKNLFQKVFKK